MKNIATALVKAQKVFEPAFKKANNPQFRSKYADLAACIDAVKEALNDNGIYLLQKNYDCDDGVKLETIFVHESGEILETGIVHFPANKHDPQGFASCLTYARRYSLLSACGIAPEPEKQNVSFADDDGNAASGKKEFISTVNVNQITDLMAAMDETTTGEELFEAYKLALESANNEDVWKKKVIERKNIKKAQLGVK
jgi:hypothetical protein